MATTNAADHANGNTATPEIPVTKALAQFVATAKPEQLTQELRTKVKEVLIDYIGVAVGGIFNAHSTEPICNAIKAFQGPGIGTCTAIAGGPPCMLPQYAGLLNAAFAHSLDFDDTYAEGTLHAGVTALSAAMTQSELLGNEAPIDDFILAVCIGYEINCRLGRELGFESYHRGFHNTSTAGIFGAVGAIAVLKHLPVDKVEMAFGLAGSKAGGSMQYLDNGSWNKRLHPGFAVHDAFMCVSLAEAGVVGATRIFEGQHGFLQAYSPKADKDLRRLVSGLGSEWIWLNSSLKPFPACRMTHTFIEMAGNIGATRKVSSGDIKAIKIKLPPTNLLLVGDATPNKIHPTNHIDAQFSVYFQVANALLYGSNTGIQAYQKLEDSEIMALCSKTTVTTDPALTVFAGWLQIEWCDGHIDEAQMQDALGEVQHPFTRDRVDEKFLSLLEPSFGVTRAQKVISMIDSLEKHSVGALFSLLQ
ncbi:uncharacterized protein MYCFIDRAFT_215554 [Pseudocercospora fijiensis CIRAD86]|uniref:MmgE/PrpD family protein n=1 Tax=Pseudocercospora fijiensis (strain CIRAD86) TaxID=383855 RepID=M2YWB1_PSEFD|nr:uncharacterized protein MYCFIDRAFT_215554 [Pseudocercospora fijiensis CIRAD86]EME82015.1 hypothetical protein MYCFIDRAFT_215554 [Pseudocercospora fijiensis CIRAD86]